MTPKNRSTQKMKLNRQKRKGNKKNNRKKKSKS
jgi:hypothetical protein